MAIRAVGGGGSNYYSYNTSSSKNQVQNQNQNLYSSSSNQKTQSYQRVMEYRPWKQPDNDPTFFYAGNTLLYNCAAAIVNGIAGLFR